MAHYYDNEVEVKSNKKLINFDIFNKKLKLYTDNGVFSKDRFDFGSRVLAEHISLNYDQKVLEVGCGYGPIAVSLLKKYDINLTLVDVNKRAIELCKENLILNNVKAKVLESSMFENITDKFDVIYSNPPIRIGKEMLYNFYKDSLNYLNEKGVLYLVIQKKQGALSTIDYLKTLFEKVETVVKIKGYFVIKAYKY